MLNGLPANDTTPGSNAKHCLVPARLRGCLQNASSHLDPASGRTSDRRVIETSWQKVPPEVITKTKTSLGRPIPASDNAMSKEGIAAKYPRIGKSALRKETTLANLGGPIVTNHSVQKENNCPVAWKCKLIPNWVGRGPSRIGVTKDGATEFRKLRMSITYGPSRSAIAARFSGATHVWNLLKFDRQSKAHCTSNL